jgi:hypothetical protein
MKTTRKALLCIAMVAGTGLALLIAGPHEVAQAASEGCGVSTIAGVYGIATAGLVSASFSGNAQRIGGFYPLTAVGTYSFDGHGTSARSLTVSFGGQIFPVSDSGPYTVNSDCSASATYSDGTWNLVIIGHGKEIKAMNTSPGVAVQGILSRQ